MNNFLSSIWYKQKVRMVKKEVTTCGITFESCLLAQNRDSSKPVFTMVLIKLSFVSALVLLMFLLQQYFKCKLHDNAIVRCPFVQLNARLESSQKLTRRL